MSIPNSVRLHRVLRAPPERVYRAFIDPDAKCRWMPPYGYIGKVQHSDPRVGGSYRMSFTNFRTGQAMGFGGTYQELTPPGGASGEGRVRLTDTFDEPSLPGEMRVTATFRAVSCGTELTILQENIPSPIPAESCYLGWQESLAQLASLVEAEVP